MGTSKDRLTFEEACKDLQISEDELEQLVANGEIASIKEGDTFFFKREVVSQFKKSRKTEPTIILADEDMEILDVMEEIDLDVKKTQPKAAAAAESQGSDILNLDAELAALGGAEELSIEPRAESSRASVPDDTVLNLEGLLEDDGSEGTTPIPGTAATSKMIEESSDITVEGNIGDETLMDTDLLEIGEEEDSFKLDSGGTEAFTEPTEAVLLRGGGARAMQMKRRKSHAAWTTMLALTAVLLLIPVGISLNTVFVSAQGSEPAPTDKKQPVYGWVLESADKGGQWWVEWVADRF